MTPQDQTFDVPVKVDEARTIYVTDDTAAAIRADANQQADMWLREATDLWDECDVENIDEIKAIEYKLGRVMDALSALRYLVPLPPDEDDE